jgi:hypothetical protein
MFCLSSNRDEKVNNSYKKLLGGENDIKIKLLRECFQQFTLTIEKTVFLEIPKLLTILHFICIYKINLNSKQDKLPHTDNKTFFKCPGLLFLP